MIIIAIQTLEIDTIQTIDQELHRAIDIEIIPTIEATQIIKINDIKTIDQEIIQTTDRIVKYRTTTIIKIDQDISHKIGTHTVTINKETTLNHLIEITNVIKILKTSIEVTHQNIRDK